MLGPGEAAAVGLLESGFLPLGRDFLGDGGVQGGSGSLAAGRGPVALLGHGLDHFLAGHGLAGFGQDLGGGVERAQLLGLGLGLAGLLPGLLGLAVLVGLRCCHDMSPFFWSLRTRSSADIALPQGRISTRVRPEIQAIPAGISPILASSLAAQEARQSARAGLEVGAFTRLSEQCGLAVSSPTRREERMHVNVAKEMAALAAMSVNELR